MAEFLHLIPPSEALDHLLQALPQSSYMETERIATEEALDRVLASPVTAPYPLPSFTRSTVDGYAVRAAGTYGASPTLPAYLDLIGEILMGATADLSVGPNQAALIHTGGMVPEGADAVVMVEDTQRVRESEIEVLKPAAVGQNILQVGEDVKAGDTVMEAGVWLRPQEIGGLMSLGVTELSVARRPRVGILSTGDEVVSPEAEVGPGQVRDVNSYTLSALVLRAGGDPIRRGIIHDNFKDLQKAARLAHAEDDIVIITAGSSVSTRDLTAEVINSLGEPGVIVHGILIKPGKPTILAVADGVPMVGLPGNPVSAMVVAGLFVVPIIRKLMGLKESTQTPRIPARMSVNIASETGREDYILVRLVTTEEGLPVAEPIYGRSNLIFTLVRADGMVRIPPEATGLDTGVEVEVILF